MWTNSTSHPDAQGVARRVPAGSAARRNPPARSGVSLMEVVITLTVIGVLLAMSVPSFSRSVEQAHADIAGSNLRAIWSAQRIFWLENRTFAADLDALDALDLLDPTIVAGSPRYSYSIATADNETFTAVTTRTGSEKWSGEVTIDQDGLISGAIEAAGELDIIPGFH